MENVQDEFSHESYGHYELVPDDSGFRLVSTDGDSQAIVRNQMEGVGFKEDLDMFRDILEASAKRPGIVSYRQRIAQLGLEVWEFIENSRVEKEKGDEELIWFKRSLNE